MTDTEKAFSDELVFAASRCGVCKGSGYQAPPALYAGDIGSDILVVGQNPGEMSDTMAEQKLEAQKMFAAESAREILEWYHRDFENSIAYEKLAAVFGDGWLSDFLYTNAVLCRTPNNETPSKEMVNACSVWTSMLVKKRKAIVMIGRTAATQILGNTGRTLKDGDIKKWRGKYILFIYHYASREWSSEKAAMYERKIDKIKQLLKKEF